MPPNASRLTSPSMTSATSNPSASTIKADSFRAVAHAPDAVALLVLRADHDHARLLDALVPAHAAERLEAVPLGHHDVEQYDVRLFLDDLCFQLVAVEVRHDVVPGRPENRLHHLELGVSVVDHHHLGHRAADSRGVLP